MHSIHATDVLEEINKHGSLEYPVAAYVVNRDWNHMGFVRWHWHDELELSYIKKGKAEFRINEESFVLSEGQGVFINRNILHAIHPVDDNDFIYYCIVFHPAFLFGYGNTKIAATYEAPISSNIEVRHFIFDGSHKFHTQICNILEQVYDINSTEEYGYELITRNLLTGVWLSMLKNLDLNRSHPTSERFTQLTLDEARTKEAIIFIQKNYNEAISLDDIADSIHVSKGECCRCFKRSIHISPFEYLMKYRIYIAAHMLMQKKEYMTISDLASSVGFNSSSYFNKLFKKYLQCTPTEFRVSSLKNEYFSQLLPNTK